MSKISEDEASKNKRRVNYLTWKYAEYCTASPNREQVVLHELLDYIGDICNEEGVEI